ncbi:MAG: hypothetical protein JWP18_636, partial [Solirubrobacterales bacterium]|nr:hypothetical protein [Solirubrobacterales bacterium]
MPAFKGILTPQDIKDVPAFLSGNAGKYAGARPRIPGPRRRRAPPSGRRATRDVKAPGR